MGDINTEKVDWVIPVAKGVRLGSVPTSNLAKAAEQHGIQFDVGKDESGGIVADVYEKVVEGMPAPRIVPPKPQKLDK